LEDDVKHAGTQVVKEDEMREYSAEIERQMKWFYQSLSEKDRRRYAAVEAEKLGFGGVEYVSRLLGCDAKTIRQGREDLQQPEDPVPDRVRKKGVVPSG
jgi:nucleosome binding factor SPN SPT16 subunit